MAAIDPTVPAYDIKTLDRALADSIAPQRFNLFLLGTFAASALVLALVGIYGVIAYSVAARTREIGVRVALGADPGRILALVLGSGMRVALLGALVGTGGALALTGLLKSLLFGVKAHDPATFAAVPAVLIAVALLAAYLPARRASRLAPVDALKVE